MVELGFDKRRLFLHLLCFSDELVILMLAVAQLVGQHVDRFIIPLFFVF